MAGNDGAASIRGCVVRFARLASDGSTPAGATNMFVLTGLVKLEAKLAVETGDEFIVKDACGRLQYVFKDVDHPKRYDATLTWISPDPELAEMLTSGQLITSGGQSIGYGVPLIGASAPVGVSMEIWSLAWGPGGSAPPPLVYTDGSITSGSTTLNSNSANFTSADAGRTISGTGIPGSTTITTVSSSTSVVMSQAATATNTGVTITIGRPGPFFRSVFPKFQAVLQDFSIENGARQAVFVGPLTENKGIGNGPANDFPSGADTSRYHWWFRDSAAPTAALGYQATPTQV